MKANISDLHSFISKKCNLKHALQASIAVNDENVYFTSSILATKCTE
jgi:hypothetical protein